MYDKLAVDELLLSLSVDEKVSLTSGRDFWHTTPIPSRGIPSIRLSDGPNGIRGTRIFDSTPSACLPCGTALGATFDVGLMIELGHLQAEEAKAKGAVVALGPTLNIQRGPLGGRGFESFSEDPLLSGVMAGHYCCGIQQINIAATLKHFVCNDMEHERTAVNVLVTQRALREIYLLPFMLAISIGNPCAIMTAYNKVNGKHVSEDSALLRKILRDEWGYQGLVMSDWFGTYSTTESIEAGVDLEMPGPGRFRGPALSQAVRAKKVKESQLDDCVRRVLNLLNYSTGSGVPENAIEKSLNRAEDQLLLRRAAAESIVLLKNENHVLPFSKSKKTAIIGPNAKVVAFCGGGSASLTPYYSVSPYEAISHRCENTVYSQGSKGYKLLPQLGNVLRTEQGVQGFNWRAFNEPAPVVGRKVIEERILRDTNMFFLDYEHEDLAPIWYSQSEGIFTPDESGIYDFGLAVEGTAKLYVDDVLLVSNDENQTPGETLFGSGTIEEISSKELTAGQDYRIRVEWGCARTSRLPPSGSVGGKQGGLRFGAYRQIDPVQAIEDAVEVARTADQVVLLVGLNGEWESEGIDRKNLELPPHTDALVARVLSVNANTAVVIQTGTTVEMPWIDEAKAVIHAWFGGNETGNGIADVVFGDVNPSGKLPLSIPRRLQDNPTYLNFRSEGGRVLYGEDVYVGYRYYDKVNVEPLFPFGHGLSYSIFKLHSLHVQVDDTIRLSLHVSNLGSYAGAEVVQVYVAPRSASIERPVKELKGFQKVHLQSQETRQIVIEMNTVLSTSYFDETRDQWCSEAGEYNVLIGTSSAETPLQHLFKTSRTKYWSALDMDASQNSAVPSLVPKPDTRASTHQACDACRHRKRRCSFSTANSPIWNYTVPSSESATRCNNCEKWGYRCTFLLPLRVRGPKRKTNHHPLGGGEVEPDMSNSQSPFSPRSLLSLSSHGNEDSAWLMTTALETTSPTWDRPTYPTDLLCPRSLVLYILSDYLKYVYPLLPVVHRPTFEINLNDNRDQFDEEFFSLIISLCAATVALLPSRFQSYLDFMAPLPFSTRTDMISHCYKIHQSFKNTRYFDTISHGKWASTFLLSIAFQQVGNANLLRMLEVEAMQLLRMLEVQYVSSHTSLNAVEVQLRKKAFWLMFFGYVHNTQNPRNERLSFLDPEILHRICVEELIPAPVDDEFITTSGILPCAEALETGSLTAGFNINIRLFCAAIERQHTSCFCCSNEDARVRLDSLNDQLHNVKYMLDTLMPPHSPWNRKVTNGDEIETIQREILLANIHITHLWVQSAILCQIDAILSEQTGLPYPPKLDRTEPPEVTINSTLWLWDKQEDVCRQMLQTLRSFSLSALEPNGISVVYKARDMAVPLLACPFDADDKRGRRAREFLREFCSFLSILDGSKTVHTASLRSWVDLGQQRSSVSPP
ncbi:hypothetical protein PV08_07931 [Exophiala spinifera]|uniref:beta-glucosidase n=1 Tax=Exophiala spinifera TaxID=91928 RepID=A0A0D2B2A0_9EURO|nr:uncharacterized protein PV08_07931 [Exophiala spinifera]KIW12745.1 hypothetical protein PV08_07931 [Exophiala spinifera]